MHEGRDPNTLPPHCISSLRYPFAELFEAQGHKTYSAMGVLWIEAGRLSVISVTSTAPVNATKEEMDRLLRKSRRVMAIFPTSSATGIKSGTFWVRDREYGLHSLQRQFRQHVQRAAKECSVRALDWDTLRSKGRNCYLVSLQRRGAAGSPTASQAGWDRFCEVGASISGLEPWACFYGGGLLAYLIAHSGGGVCEAFMLHRSEAALSFRAVHLLFYEFTRAMIQRPGINAVTVGREWFPPYPSLSQFKKHAGYHTEEIQLAVVLNPAVRLVLGNAFTRKMLGLLRTVTRNYSARFDSLEALEAAATTRLPSCSAGYEPPQTHPTHFPHDKGAPFFPQRAKNADGTSASHSTSDS
jgi:hypothetical protein